MRSSNVSRFVGSFNGGWEARRGRTGCMLLRRVDDVEFKNIYIYKIDIGIIERLW